MTQQSLEQALKSIWWLVLIRGILLILLGIFAIIWPGATILMMTVLFGAYALVDGLFFTAGALRSRKDNPGWGWLLAQGLLMALAGLITLVLPLAVGTLVLLGMLWFIVISLVVGGIMEIGAARGLSSGKGWQITSGAINIVFGLLLGALLLASPGLALTTMVWMIAFFAILIGAVLLFGAISMRRLQKQHAGTG